MELTRESIYVKIIMLKTVITNENGYGGTLEGVPFRSSTAVKRRPKCWTPFSLFEKSEKEAAI